MGGNVAEDSAVILGFCKGCGANFDYPGDFCKCKPVIPKEATEIEGLRILVKHLEKRLEQERAVRVIELEHLKDRVIFWRRLARNVNVTARTIL